MEKVKLSNANIESIEQKLDELKKEKIFLNRKMYEKFFLDSFDDILPEDSFAVACGNGHIFYFFIDNTLAENEMGVE